MEQGTLHVGPGLSPGEAAAVYLWAVGDLRREPPESVLAGAGLRRLVEIAGDALEREPVELGEPGDGVEVRLSDLDERRLGPFARESETSRQAALKVYPRQGSQRRRVLDAIGRGVAGQRGGGATRNELAHILGLVENTVRPRVRELIVGGWVEESRRTRQTDMGRDAAVLVLTERGRAEWWERRS